MSECCKYCGQEYRDAVTASPEHTNHHPSGPYKGKHALFVSDTLGPFCCVHCEWHSLPGDFRTVRQSLFYLGGAVSNETRLNELEKESSLENLK